MSRTGKDRDRDGHYVSQKVGHGGRSESGHKMLKSKRKKESRLKGEVGRWGRKTSKAKIPASFQFSILLGRFACVIPRHVSSTSGAAEDGGCDGRGRRWKDRCGERCVGDRRGRGGVGGGQG